MFRHIWDFHLADMNNRTLHLSFWLFLADDYPRNDIDS